MAIADPFPARRNDVLASLQLTRKIYRKHGFEYIGGFVVNGRAAEHVIDLIFDKTDPDDTARAYAAFKEGMLENAKLGYGVYRTNTAFMDLAAETYGPAQRAFNKQLKQRARSKRHYRGPGSRASSTKLRPFVHLDVQPWPQIQATSAARLSSSRAQRQASANPARSCSRKNGAAVVVADVNPELGAQTVRDLEAFGAHALFIKTDVSISSDVQAMIAQTIDRFGRLDVAINNAGISPKPLPVANIDENNWDKVIAIDLKGAMLCIKYELRQMIEAARGGAIINIASIAGIVPEANSGPYVAAKAGVIGLTKGAAIENAHHGIRVNAIAPGWGTHGDD